MEEIIPAVDRELIIDELTEDKFLRHTNKIANQLYLVTAHNSPNIMREIGRLREIAFREAGGGTGKSMDIDEYDISEFPYQQLIVWDPEDQEIISAYRLLKCWEASRDSSGKIMTATSHLFHLSDTFYENYLPYTLELGRSFVQPKYQRGGISKKGLFSVDNLWDGLGAIVVLNSDIKYMFGKVTMYPHFNREARNLLLGFLHHYFPDEKKLVVPMRPLISKPDLVAYGKPFEGMNYKEGYALLNREVRQRGENIPPLINAYMGISDSMKTFGTAINGEFGEVEETGILITVDEIFESRKERHLETFDRDRNYIGPLEKKKQ